MERQFGDYGGFEYAGSYDDIAEANAEKKNETVETPVEMTQEQSQEVGKGALEVLAKQEAENKAEQVGEKKTLRERARVIREKMMTGYTEFKEKIKQADWGKVAKRGIATALLIAKLGSAGDGKETAKGEGNPDAELPQEPRIEERTETASYDDEEDLSIEDVLEFQNEERIRGREFSHVGSVETQDGTVDVYHHVGGYNQQNDPFYKYWDDNEKDHLESWGTSWESESPAEMATAEIREMTDSAHQMAMWEWRLKRTSHDSFDSLTRRAEEIKAMAVDDYDELANGLVDEIMGQMKGGKINVTKSWGFEIPQGPTDAIVAETPGMWSREMSDDDRGKNADLLVDYVSAEGEQLFQNPEIYEVAAREAGINPSKYGDKIYDDAKEGFALKFKKGSTPAKVTPTPTSTTTPEVTPEPVITPEPTPVVTEEPTPTPTEKPTPTPEPVVTPTPTEKPTPTPEPVITPTPTEKPTPVPTEKPTPEPTPVPTEKPTPEPTPVVTPEPKPTKDPEAVAEPVQQVEQQEHVQQTVEPVSEQGPSDRPESIGQRTEPETTTPPDTLADQLADLGL